MTQIIDPVDATIARSESVQTLSVPTVASSHLWGSLIADTTDAVLASGNIGDDNELNQNQVQETGCSVHNSNASASTISEASSEMDLAAFPFLHLTSAPFPRPVILLHNKAARWHIGLRAMSFLK
jgi:hypothetical protein